MSESSYNISGTPLVVIGRETILGFFKLRYDQLGREVIGFSTKTFK